MVRTEFQVLLPANQYKYNADVSINIIISLISFYMKRMLTIVLETANVTPAWLGAMSAWLLRCPAELHAQRPMDIETKLQNNNPYIIDVQKNPIFCEKNIQQYKTHYIKI